MRNCLSPQPGRGGVCRWVPTTAQPGVESWAPPGQHLRQKSLSLALLVRRQGNCEHLPQNTQTPDSHSWMRWSQLMFLQEGSKKMGHVFLNTMWPSYSTPRSRPKTTENRCTNKNVYTDVNSSIMHNSQKVEMAQTSISGRRDKWKMVYPYTGIVFSHKKGCSTDTGYIMNEPWQRYAQWEKPDTKSHIL